MISTMIALAALGMQAEAAPQQAPRLSVSAQAALRCSAAFALVAHGQEIGNEASLQWPAIDPQGREYFVRSLAQIMDETGIDRDQAAELVRAEAERLLDQNEIDSVMPACLALLDAARL